MASNPADSGLNFTAHPATVRWVWRTSTTGAGVTLTKGGTTELMFFADSHNNDGDGEPIPEPTISAVAKQYIGDYQALENTLGYKSLSLADGVGGFRAIRATPC